MSEMSIIENSSEKKEEQMREVAKKELLDLVSKLRKLTDNILDCGTKRDDVIKVVELVIELLEKGEDFLIKNKIIKYEGQDFKVDGKENIIASLASLTVETFNQKIIQHKFDEEEFRKIAYKDAITKEIYQVYSFSNNVSYALDNFARNTLNFSHDLIYMRQHLMKLLEYCEV